MSVFTSVWIIISVVCKTCKLAIISATHINCDMRLWKWKWLHANISKINDEFHKMSNSLLLYSELVFWDDSQFLLPILFLVCLYRWGFTLYFRIFHLFVERIKRRGNRTEPGENPWAPTDWCLAEPPERSQRGGQLDLNPRVVPVKAASSLNKKNDGWGVLGRRPEIRFTERNDASVGPP